MPRGNTILIIEDDEDIRELLLFLLERESFRVEQAIDGEQAGERIKSAAPPDLVLLDIMMPFRDGFEILREIKSAPQWQQVPVLMITASEQEEHIARGFEAGICDYIKKPFKPDDLLVRIRQALARDGET